MQVETYLLDRPQVHKYNRFGHRSSEEAFLARSARQRVRPVLVLDLDAHTFDRNALVPDPAPAMHRRSLLDTLVRTRAMAVGCRETPRRLTRGTDERLHGQEHHDGRRRRHCRCITKRRT